MLKRSRRQKAPLSLIDLKIRRYVHTRWAARGAVLLATLTSVWANWLHASHGWIPVTISVMPPLIVLVGFEFTAHIPAWEGPWWHPRRYVRPVAMIGITGIGAWLSYFHQNAAFLHYSGDPETALLLPLAIDGLMIIASVGVLDLNVRINQLIAHKEAGGISTYIPPASKPKKPEGDMKKEQIAVILKKSPELSLADIAGRVNASLTYVKTVATQLHDPRALDAPRRRRRHKPQTVEAAA